MGKREGLHRQTILIKYYRDDQAQHGSMWKPTPTKHFEEAHAPRLLAFPLVLLDLICKEGCPLMAYEVLKLVATKIMVQLGKEDAALGDAWSFVVHWRYYLASQTDKDNESLVVLTLDAITKMDDEYLGRWLEQRLDNTLGTHPRGTTHERYITTPAGTAHAGGTTLAVSSRCGGRQNLKPGHRDKWQRRMTRHDTPAKILPW